MLINLILTMLLLNPLTGSVVQTAPVFDIAEVDAKAPSRINLENIGVKVTAERYVVIDVASGELLASQKATSPQAIASITKLMTALVILDLEPDWQMEVEMSKVDETVGAFPHIYRGEKVKFIDLWKSALVSSDNNSIVAMIRALGISKNDFVELMNDKAVELKMHNTRFADPTGLDENNLSTALDVARLLHSALDKNEIRESVLQGKYQFKILSSGKNRVIYNTDILIDSFLNRKSYGYELMGGKTGFLYESGYCLTTQIKKDNHEIIIVVLNSDTIENRFQDVKVLADWIFSNYEW
ncbi:D-alanyl-D-alanine carboxypeptidase [Candidatus Falkowbacteria bacterium]|jgi:serine-type D-Ala-D-Ala endopeptidase (penicillin-binding protein 7)|nr:D-alanyl-D-alanine carboxypeptidase [Candidatus Falkowbacteria bacterium]MBT7007747.1 D-alanyl-D-alanine carboxypeptidase [Candidatus Falkowbacteria bacterium]